MKSMGREETRGSDSEGVRREKNKGRRRSERVYCEKGWMSKRKYFFLGQKKIIFTGAMHNVIERLFSNFFFGKQPIENKLYFYKSFLLTKNSFPLINLFLCYQTLENVENYFYKKFFSETNRASRNKICFPTTIILSHVQKGKKKKTIILTTYLFEFKYFNYLYQKKYYTINKRIPLIRLQFLVYQNILIQILE